MKKLKRIGVIVMVMCVMLIALGCKGDTSSTSKDNTEVATTSLQRVETTTSQLETTASQPETTASQTETVVSQLETSVSQLETSVSQTETVVSQPETSVSQPETSVSQPKLTETDRVTDVNSKFVQTTWAFDENKIANASEKGFEAPFEVIEKGDYKPNLEDAIQYDSNLLDEALYQSMKYKGTEGMEIVYDINKLTWNDFFGDLDYSQYDSVKTVSLKGSSIYEAEIVDDYEKYFRYYDENEGVYYEVSELMMGNFTDPNAVLTKKVMGNSCFYKGISGLSAPTYNPFILEKNEQVLNCQITTLAGEPAVYIETKMDDQLHEEWVSVKYGILVKQLIFDQEGLLKRRSIATHVKTKIIEDAVFYKPSDVDFRDITLFVFSMTGGDTKTLAGAVENTIPKEPHSMTLQSNTGEKKVIHSGGLDEMALDRPLYFTESESMNGEERTVIEYRSEAGFYTICPELKIAEIYEKSCFELRFFDFEKAGLYRVTEEGNLKSYTFYDNHVDSVSGMVRFYEYTIDKVQNKIISIKMYNKESLADDVIAGEISDYKIAEIGKVNEQLYEIPADYKIIDHGDKSNNDGENMPFWYQ